MEKGLQHLPKLLFCNKATSFFLKNCNPAVTLYKKLTKSFFCNPAENIEILVGGLVNVAEVRFAPSCREVSYFFVFQVTSDFIFIKFKLNHKTHIIILLKCAWLYNCQIWIIIEIRSKKWVEIFSRYLAILKSTAHATKVKLTYLASWRHFLSIHVPYSFIWCKMDKIKILKKLKNRDLMKFPL